MTNKQIIKEKYEPNQNEEKKLSNINLFFSAFGNFLSGIFCISQFFLTGNLVFGYITIGIIAIIVIVTYSISYSKTSLKNDLLWDYITDCANRVGPFNPFCLLFSIILALNADIETIVVWIMIEFLHLWIYTNEFRKNFPHFRLVFVRKFRNYIKNNTALILTFLLAILFWWLWYICPENNRYADLWLNLSSGFIASSITISVIDRILKKQKETNEQPLRQAMYRDIQLFVSRFIQLWREMYLHSVEDRVNMTVEEFFAPSSIENICNSLDLSCTANVYPEQNWFSYIENARKDLESRGQKILATYSNIADPEVLQSIHYLINDSAYLGRLSLIAQVHNVDIIERIPRPTLLACYTIAPKELDLTIASQLFTWCRTQYENIYTTSKESAIIVMPIPTQLDFQTDSTKVTSAITKEKLSKMSNDFYNWQQTNENH